MTGKKYFVEFPSVSFYLRTDPLKNRLMSMKLIAALWGTLMLTLFQATAYAQAPHTDEANPVQSHIQVIGKDAIYRLHFRDATHLDVTVMADPSYPAGTLNHFEIRMTEIRPDVYIATWIEPATGNTVTHVDDFANNLSYTQITDLASKGFWRMKGEIRPVHDTGDAAEIMLAVGRHPGQT